MTAREKPKQMTVKARRAYETYRDLGPKRSLRQVSELIGHKNLTTVRDWSARYRWQELVDRHDHAQLREQLGKREVKRETGRQSMIDMVPLAVQAIRDILIDNRAVPVKDRQGNPLKDDKGNLITVPVVKASTKLEAAKTLLDRAGLPAATRIETEDRSGEQLDEAARVLAGKTPEQLRAMREALKQK